MKAILVSNDKSLLWTDVPDPICGENEVVIDIHAAALNRADLMQRAGNYPPPAGWPKWMGLEVAGVVSVAPQNSRWKVGDRVCALLGGGGYAEKVAVPEELVLPIPDGLSFAEAATIPEAFATSYLNIMVEGQMQPGETVFVAAGASGLGTAAIQLAKALGGKVITTVSSEDKAELVRNLGADIIINRKTQDVAQVLAEHGVDVAMDCVAGENLGACLNAMNRGGRWVIIATLGGRTAELDMLTILMKGIRVIGSTLRSRPNAMKATVLNELKEKTWDKFSSREIKSVIYRTLPITQAEEAHAILERNENLGKVVLIVRDYSDSF